MASPEQKLKRLLHLGSEFLSYKTSEKLLSDSYHTSILSTIEDQIALNRQSDAANCILKAYSDGYSAHPALLVYALAVCVKQTKSESLRHSSYRALKTVCSSSENLFLFIKFAIKLSHNNSIWGSGFKKLCKDWYKKKDVKALAESIGRQKRNHGWSHKDIVKLIHLKTSDDPARAAIVKYLLFGIKEAKKEFGENSEASDVLNYLQGVEDFKRLTDEQQAARNIEVHKYTLDHVPPHLVKCKEVWGALIGNIPLATLLKNLERIGYLGFLKPNSILSKKVVDALNDENAIAESHLHPAQVYITLRKYEMSSKFFAAEKARKKRRTENGGGETKKLIKTPPEPNQAIIFALHNLFLSTCKLFLAPTGLKYSVVIDMKRLSFSGKCDRCPCLTPIQASAVIALCLLHADRNVSVRVAGANDELVPVALTTSMTVQQAVKKLEEGRKEVLKLSTPLEWALTEKEERDVFVVITDNIYEENIIFQTFENYRTKMNLPNVKPFIKFLGKNGREVFIVEGFDRNVPRLIEAFSRGAF